MCVVLLLKICSILPNSKLLKLLKFVMSDTKFMNTCAFTISLKKISACSKMLVECIIYFGEHEEASSSSFQVASLTLMRHLLILRN